MEAPVGASKGAGRALGWGRGGGSRQRPRLSSTDERCIPSYRGDAKSCAAAPPPTPPLPPPLPLHRTMRIVGGEGGLVSPPHYVVGGGEGGGGGGRKGGLPLFSLSYAISYKAGS
nr:hypothetical protein [Morchella crassipes]